MGTQDKVKYNALKSEAYEMALDINHQSARLYPKSFWRDAIELANLVLEMQKLENK